MTDAKNAFRKMTADQRERFVEWMRDLEREEELRSNKRIDAYWAKEYAKLGTDPHRTPEQRQRENDIDLEMGS
jgi:DNA/RNA-binding domain of Phe-tRNA-synthetase-like protein